MNRVWSQVSRILGGLFLFGGGTIAIALMVGIFTSHASGIGLAILSMVLIVFGLAPTLLGAGLLYASDRAQQQALREKFFALLRMGNGRVSVLDFVATTHLEPAIARRYLDQWAREFDANFEVSEAGNIYYQFSPELLSLPENLTLQSLQVAIRQFLQSAG